MLINIKKEEREVAKQLKNRVCKKCNNLLPKKSTVCQYCGTKYKKPFFQRAWFIILAVIIIIGWMGDISSSNNEELSERENIQLSESVENEAKENINDKNNELHVLNETSVDKKIDMSSYYKMDAQLLFEYGHYMKNEKVVTAITIADIDREMFKAKTENNDSLFFSIICELYDEKYYI